MTKRGRPRGPEKARIHTRVHPETLVVLQGYAAQAGKSLGASLDEWSNLVKQRDDLIQTLRRLEDEAYAADQQRLKEVRAMKRQADDLRARLRSHQEKALSSRRGRELEAAIRAKTLQRLARVVPCQSCQGALTAGDLDLEQVTCGPCRHQAVLTLEQQAKRHTPKGLSVTPA